MKPSEFCPDYCNFIPRQGKRNICGECLHLSDKKVKPRQITLDWCGEDEHVTVVGENGNELYIRGGHCSGVSTIHKNAPFIKRR